MKLKPQLILALDVNTYQEAVRLIDMLYPTVRVFKVGAQLFTVAGQKIVAYLHKRKAEVFLDLKFHDIPNTVASAVRQAASLRVKMLTLHISGGEEMLASAVQSLSKVKGRRPLLIGVTILTSQKASVSQVVALARQGLACGLDGVVASAREVEVLRNAIHKDFIIVTPGIRPKGADMGDQKRVATAEQAARLGSNFLVVGRPILEAVRPLQVAKEILEEIRHGRRY